MSRTAGDLAPTPGQTVGPFYGYALPYDGDSALVPVSHPEAVRLHGRVLDGAGDPVPDALLELWQADPAGRVSREPGSLRRDGFTFTGWGRCATDSTGHYAFSTLRPGPAAAGAAPYFAVTVFARGLLNRLFTRAYLPGDDAALAADPLLSSVDEGRRGTLVAGVDGHGFVFDIRLQGEDETVFLTYPRH
jgi:protocatechuate 3,4-dioxygenase alpha subunit